MRSSIVIMNPMSNEVIISIRSDHLSCTLKTFRFHKNTYSNAFSWSPGLQAIAYTLQNSYKELGLLIFLICISGFIFASLAYFIEIEEDSGFTSIPTAFYWVVITMTTIGYGDIFPVTGESRGHREKNVLTKKTIATNINTEYRV